ncbi:MAG: hypothetical protein J6S85_19430 [Methanobrevibacter sp.]|nr:hypothetical protein [Methanobrevibacter sp.]
MKKINLILSSYPTEDELDTMELLDLSDALMTKAKSYIKYKELRDAALRMYRTAKKLKEWREELFA